MRNVSPALIIVCGLLSCHWLLSQDAPYSIRLDTSLVSLDFTVADSMGKAITDLNRYDFEVLDNGEPRPIVNFAPVKTPYNMVLLLDCSESTQDRMKLLVPALAGFIDQLRPQDRALVAIFGTDVETVIDWDHKEKYVNTVDSPNCHGTNFYKTLEWAERKLRGVSGRRGVVVFTDGQESDVARKEAIDDGVRVRQVVPTAEDRGFQNVLKLARSSGVPYYFVAVDTDLNPGVDYGGSLTDLRQFRTRMQEMADGTGGRVVFPQSRIDVVPFFLQITRDLGTSYSLGFTPAKAANSKGKMPHTIEVRVRGEDYRVRQTRDSYIAN